MGKYKKITIYSNNARGKRAKQTQFLKHHTIFLEIQGGFYEGYK